jgi:hypothetical protein
MLASSVVDRWVPDSIGLWLPCSVLAYSIVIDRGFQIETATHDLPHGASMLHCNHNPTKSGTHDLPHSMRACYTVTISRFSLEPTFYHTRVEHAIRYP